ncbi:MAG TPA: choice-of-anchor L domain-containing protein [Bacteroidia bacterium]|nr:choice-of-anchor L domain-containing protein [Bacteroidia bacterium]
MQLSLRSAFYIFICFLFSLSAGAQLTVTGGISNTTFQSYLFGHGVTISNLTFNCSGANQYGTFNAQLTQLGLDSGILISTGTIQEAIGPNNQCCSSVAVGTNSTDACVNAALGSPQQQYDPCIIEFDIVPQCDTFNVSYVFGSEEYNTGIGGYNDVFGFFVSGPNPTGGTYACQDFALLPGSAIPVTINNVNFKTNTAYYRDNHTTASNLYTDFQPNGLTVPLTATIPVIACQSYHMKIAVVDIGNPGYDSWAFIKFQSLACAADQILTIQNNDTTLCQGSAVTLNATGAANYTWSPGTGLNATTGAQVNASPGTSTTYTVSAVVAGTCQSKDSVIVNIQPPPKANFSADSLSGCYPLCVHFTNTSIAGTDTITGFTWNFGDGDTTGYHQQNPAHCYTKPGAYTVILSLNTRVCNNQKVIPAMINVYDYPRASFTYTPLVTNIFSPTIYFTNTSTDLYGIANAEWELGDGTDTMSEQYVTHAYADTGLFCAKLIVTNIHSCMSSAENCVYIEPLFTLYVPNAFTPNHDGLDDVFMAKGGGFKTFDMWIFDRWGGLIFHSNNINKGWDGTVQARKCQEDTYIWTIQTTDNEGNSQNYVGRVSLIR